MVHVGKKGFHCGVKLPIISDISPGWGTEGEYREMNAPQNDESVLAEYMSRDELAEDLNRCTRTLDRWHSLRIGPPRTIIGKRVLYRRQAVAEWLRSQEEPPSSSRAA